LHSSSGRNEVIPKSQCSVVGRYLLFAATDIGCYGEGNACFPASTSPQPLHAGFVFWSPASSGRVKAVAIRRCSGADLVPYLPCAVCTASSTGYRSQDSLFSAPCPFPRREDSVQYLRTQYDAAASCFNNAPTATQILENTPQARDMATGYGDQSSSSQLFPLFGKLRFSQKTKDKFQKASQGPIGHSVACLETVVAALCRGRDCCRECAESYQCTSCTCEFTIPEPPLTTTFTWIFKSPLG
jgi:hypothetical protein